MTVIKEEAFLWVSQRLKTVSLILSHKNRMTETQRRKAGASDPFHIAEYEDEQDPEEHSNRSGSDEYDDLHVGLITGT